MARPIRVWIRQKVQVPSNSQVHHQQRSDWIRKAIITPEESFGVFRCINGTGLIANDAQFAKLIFDNFGQGEYSCIAWKHGQKGFWSFLHVICFEDRFKRVETGMTPEQKEAREQMTDYNRLKVQYSTAEDDNEKESILSEMRSTEDMLSVNQEIIKLSKGGRRGPYPYLKTTQPIFKEHEYEEYRTEYKDEHVETGVDFWSHGES